MKLITMVAGILLAASPAMAEPLLIDFTQPVLIDGKTIPNIKTHDPADYVTVKDGPKVGDVVDLDPKCSKCLPFTLGDAIELALTNVTPDEERSRKPTIPTRESWAAFAAKLKTSTGTALTPKQVTLIEDRIDAVYANAALATVVKKRIDPDYLPKLPE